MIYTDTYSGIITVEKNLVTKKFNENAINQGLMEREKKWLLHLIDFDRVPKIIKTYDNIIEMTYVGERITKENIPIDWEKQIEYIYKKLKEFNCSHNDIKPEELLVKENKIYIVDFGWSTETTKPIPANWPREIGDKFAYGVHNFDDLYSLEKSINYILNKTND